MSQDMKFVKPVHLGETVRARVTVTEIDQEKTGVSGWRVLRG